MDTGPQNGPQRDHHGDQAETYSPARAAEVLDLSKRRVLQMLERGELVGNQDPETGRWSIPVPHVEDLRRRREEDQRKKPPKPEQSATDRELVEVLRDQVEDLRARLDAADQRDRDQRRIIAALTSRIPELPSAPVQTGEDAPHGPEGPGPTPTPLRGTPQALRRAIRAVRSAILARSGVASSDLSPQDSPTRALPTKRPRTVLGR